MGTKLQLPSQLDKDSKEFIQDLADIKSHGFAKIITMTVGDDFIKKYADRSRKEARPRRLEGLKKLTMQVVSVGHSYEKLIENQLSKLGKESSFNPEACKYSKKFSENGIVRVNLKDVCSYYIRYYPRLNAVSIKTYEEVFINELGEAVSLDKATKEKWFNAKGHSKKQENAGVEKEILPRNVKLDNLFYFQKGEKVLNRLTPKQMELLDLEYV